MLPFQRLFCSRILLNMSLIGSRSRSLTVKNAANFGAKGLNLWKGTRVSLIKGTIGTGFALCFVQKVNCNVSEKVEEELKAGDEAIVDFITEKGHEKVTPKGERDHFNWSRLWGLLEPDKIYLVVAVASALVVALLNIQIPLVLGQLTNVLSQFVSKDNTWKANEFVESVKSPAMALLGMYALQGLFTFVNITSLSISGEKMGTRLREQLFASIIRQDIAFFDETQSGEIVNRLTTDVQDFKSAFKMCISQGLRSLTQSLGCAISLYLISPKMTILMATVVSSLVIVGSFLGTTLRAMSRKAQDQVAKATAIASEAIGSVRTVRAFALEEAVCESYNKEVEKGEVLQVDLGLGIGAFQGLTNLALNGIVLSTLLFGGYLLSNNEVTAGNLMSFLVATQTIQRSLAQMSLIYGQYVKAISAGSRVFQYLDMKPVIRSFGGKRLTQVTGEIEFKGVTFKYPTRPDQLVLDDFNLHILPGKVTAVCGLSGAGKSTLAALLERFYDVNSGSILINGEDVRNLDPLWLRGKVIGYINQEPTLFATTIKENIRLGCPDASDEEVYEAAIKANADAFIRSFPEGYDTVVGERGVAVSGGQKQRIAIARAILKDPVILVLDEATSALDAHSEKLVQEALEKVIEGKTVLVIAHRLSTIQNADVIVVLSKGRLAEIGNHSSLKKKRGLYWDLIRRQQDHQDSSNDAY